MTNLSPDFFVHGDDDIIEGCPHIALPALDGVVVLIQVFKHALHMELIDLGKVDFHIPDGDLNAFNPECAADSGVDFHENIDNRVYTILAELLTQCIVADTLLDQVFHIAVFAR